MALPVDTSRPTSTSLLGLSRSALALLRPAESEEKLYPGSSLGSSIYAVPFTFQFFPETITDNKAVKWASIDIPGSSHPLYQWVEGGERTIGFNAVFARDTGIINDSLTDAYGNYGAPVTKYVYGDRFKFTRDINASIAALRWYIYPDYADGKAHAPCRAYLTLENTHLGYARAQSILVIMTVCNSEIRSWFPNGEPRFATVQLEFKEVIQEPESGINMLGRSDVLPDWYVAGGLYNGAENTATRSDPTKNYGTI